MQISDILWSSWSICDIAGTKESWLNDKFAQGTPSVSMKDFKKVHSLETPGRCGIQVSVYRIVAVVKGIQFVTDYGDLRTTLQATCTLASLARFQILQELAGISPMLMTR